MDERPAVEREAMRVLIDPGLKQENLIEALKVRGLDHETAQKFSAEIFHLREARNNGDPESQQAFTSGRNLEQVMLRTFPDQPEQISQVRHVETMRAIASLRTHEVNTEEPDVVSLGSRWQNIHDPQEKVQQYVDYARTESKPSFAIVSQPNEIGRAHV